MLIVKQDSRIRQEDRLNTGLSIYCLAAFAHLIKCLRIIDLVAVSFALLETASGQGFINLNFEQARSYVSPTPVNGYGSFIDPALAFPGWSISNAMGGGATVVFYNDYSLGSPAVDLMGPNFPNAVGFSPLQGGYSVFLQYFGYAGGPPTLSQTGMIPVDAQSITFIVASGISPFLGLNDSFTNPIVMLNGVNIPLFPISGGRLAGDVTAFAGTVAQLTFSTPISEGGSYFDNVQFSTSSIPEPGVLSLFSVCIVLLRWRIIHTHEKLRWNREKFVCWGFYVFD
jgi:hypothetical protein